MAAIVALVVLAAIAAVATVETEWGRAFALRTLVARVNLSMQGRGTLRVAHLDGGLQRPIVADSISLRDAAGAVVLSADRVMIASDWFSAIRGRVHVSLLTLTRPFARIEQARDGSWNIARMFASPSSGAPGGASTLSVVIDSVAVTDGRFELVQPDTGTRRVQHRTFDQLQLALGVTHAVDPSRAGGDAQVRQLSFALSDPPVSLRSLAGRAQWGKDSVALDLPSIRLAASHGTARGVVSWAGKGGTRIDIRAAFDTMAIADVAWISPMLPADGVGRTSLHVHTTAAHGEMAYALTELDLRAAHSRLTGALTAIVGHGVEIRDLALEAAPVDLALVRVMMRADVPKAPWAGWVEGSIHGAGGPLSALRLDTIALTWHDARVPGATGHVLIGGTVDASASPAALHDFSVEFSAFDVRTFGAVAKGADSLHGTLDGRVVLDGPTANLGFHDLLLRHSDGGLPHSQLRGAGRFSTDLTTQWLEASFALDTIAPGTLLRDRTALPWRGFLHGTLGVRATADTVTMESLLQAGDGTARFTGRTVLDSTQASLSGRAVLTAFDPRALIARRDIPVLTLGGTADVTLEGPANSSDLHVLLTLDTASRIGGSHVRYGSVRAGLDATGFHVDTAELHAADWELSARGRLARTGTSTDTLTISARFAAVDSLRTLLLDTAGKALLDTLHGAVTAKGTLAGALDDFTLDALVGVHEATAGAVRVHDLIGTARLARLPDHATGTVAVTTSGVSSGSLAATGFHLDAALLDGSDARVTMTAESGDSLALRATADGSRHGDSTSLTIDTLAVTIGANQWRLQQPVLTRVTPELVEVAPFRVLSTPSGGELRGSLRLPETGDVAGSLVLRNLHAAELSLIDAMPPEARFTASANVELRGTRAAPRIRADATVDSLVVGERRAPLLQATMDYQNRAADMLLRAVDAAGGDSLRVEGRLPLDLALRGVDKRQLDGAL